MSDEVFSTFTDNPIGVFIGIMMFFVLLYALSSLSGFSPITNSTIANQLGCASCGPGGTAGGAFTFIKPFGVLLWVALPAIIAIGYLQLDKNKRPVIEPEGGEEEEDVEE